MAFHQLLELYCLLHMFILRQFTLSLDSVFFNKSHMSSFVRAQSVPILGEMSAIKLLR